MPVSTVDLSQAKVLRPELGFEAWYQGQLAQDVGTTPSVPIPFFEWPDRAPPNPFDQFAGKEGYDPDLMRFLPVTNGSLIQLWIPLIVAEGNVRRYRYRLQWRLQSLSRSNDEAESGLPNQYHVPYEAPGAPDSTVAPPARRNIMPCAVDTTAASFLPSPAVPPGISFTARTFYGADSILLDIGQTGRPLIKGSRLVPVEAVLQQGIVDPAVVTSSYPFIPVFGLVELVARGDQMMIMADRPGLDGEDNEWGFGVGQWDEGFSLLYGTSLLSGAPHKPFPDVGIYVIDEAVPRGPALQRSGPSLPPLPS